MISAAKPAAANTHQLIVILYAKFSSHELIAYHATGKAMIEAINTKPKNSFDTNTKISGTDAPRTFLTPISFVLLKVANIASPNNPRHATKMANAEKIPKALLNNCSFSY